MSRKKKSKVKEHVHTFKSMYFGVILELGLISVLKENKKYAMQFVMIFKIFNINLEAMTLKNNK